MPSPVNGLLITVIKAETKYRIHVSVILLLYIIKNPLTRIIYPLKLSIKSLRILQ